MCPKWPTEPQLIVVSVEGLLLPDAFCQFDLTICQNIQYVPGWTGIESSMSSLRIQHNGLSQRIKHILLDL